MISDGCVFFLLVSVWGIELDVSKSRHSLFHKIVFTVKRKLYTSSYYYLRNIKLFIQVFPIFSCISPPESVNG